MVKPKDVRDAWWRTISEEATSIRNGPSPRVPVAFAAAMTACLVVAGNVVVMLQRRVGGNAGELLTTAAPPLVGALGSAALLVVGWRRSDLGLVIPSKRALNTLRRPTLLLLFVVGGSAILTAVRGGSHEGISAPITLLRVAVGTAFGEELVHRGVLFALWAATGRSTRTVVLANGLAFGAWHIAAVARMGWIGRIAGICVPALLGTAFFLWGRCRSRSVAGSSLLHLSTNLPGIVVRSWAKTA